MSDIGLYGPSCTTAFGLGQLYVPCSLAACQIGLYESSCTAAFGFTRFYGPYRLAACQMLAFTALAAPQPSALADPTALVASLLFSLRPLQPQLLGSLVFGRPHGPCGQRYISNLGLYGLSCTVAFGLGRPHGPCGPRCFTAFGLYGLSCTATFGFVRPHGPRGPRSLQFILLQLSVSLCLRPTSGPSWP